MRKILFTVVLAPSVMLLAGCNFLQTQDAEKSDTGTETTVMADAGQKTVELSKVPLPCSKEMLSAAWKRIGCIDGKRGKELDYGQNSPTLFLSTNLDGDSCPEILLRGEPPHAAIFSFLNDSLQLVTFVNHRQLGISIVPEGVIVRSGSREDGSIFSEFIKLKKSEIAASGEMHETFSIKDGKMVSAGIQYMLLRDTSLVKVSREEYEKVASSQAATYIDEIDGWEDFRKP